MSGSSNLSDLSAMAAKMVFAELETKAKKQQKVSSSGKSSSK